MGLWPCKALKTGLHAPISRVLSENSHFAGKWEARFAKWDCTRGSVPPVDARSFAEGKTGAGDANGLKLDQGNRAVHPNNSARLTKLGRLRCLTVVA